jgi:hypothetical protein
VRRKTGTSTNTAATLTITRRSDGSYAFPDFNGLTVTAHANVEFDKLYKAVAAPV